MQKVELGEKREYPTDVLVVGTGLAGLRAAIEARRRGLDVTMIDKSVIGYNTNTRLAGGHVKAAATVPRPWAASTPSSVVEHFKDKILVGEFIMDQELTEILVFEAPARKFELKDFGVLALTGVDKHHLHDFYSFPQGVGLITPLISTVKKMGVKCKREVALVDLMMEDGQVVGAWGFHLPSGIVMAFPAKAVVLATGGAPEVYLRNDTAVTTTGDGFSMAYRAGAELMDMEMQHFEPFVHCEKDLPMMDRRESRAGWYGTLRNKDGEDFLPRYMKRIGKESDPFHVAYGNYNPDVRHLVSRAMALEVYEGRGDNGAVWFDLSKVPEDKWTGDRPSIYLGQVLCRGYDTHTEWVHVFPGAITTLGGIKIDEHGASTVPGLYAGGEVGGGCHGAARLGGDALTETVVFGARAGGAAAKYAAKRTAPRTPSPNNDKQIREGVDKLRGILAKKESPGYHPKEIRLQMKTTMWDNAGIIRTEETLNRAQERIDDLQANLDGMYAPDVRMLRVAVEVENMLEISQMIVKSALMRKESRGVHFRRDYPFADNENWLNNIFLTKGSGRDMNFYTRPAKMTHYSPETVPRDTGLARFLRDAEELARQKFGQVVTHA